MRTKLNIGGREGFGTYAIEPVDEDEAGSIVLVIIEDDMGGFPYIQRVFKPFYRKGFEGEIEQSLDILSALITRDPDAQE